jgi:hypothetical protein
MAWDGGVGIGARQHFVQFDDVLVEPFNTCAHPVVYETVQQLETGAGLSGLALSFISV